MWAKIDEATAEIIRSTVEPILDASRPALISAMTFTDFSLGNQAPHIDGVKVVQEEHKVILFIDLHANLHPNVTFEVKTVGLTLSRIKVDELILKAKVRIELANLVPTFPCFSKICCSFTEVPFIDYR